MPVQYLHSPTTKSFDVTALAAGSEQVIFDSADAAGYVGGPKLNQPIVVCGDLAGGTPDASHGLGIRFPLELIIQKRTAGGGDVDRCVLLPGDGRLSFRICVNGALTGSVGSTGRFLIKVVNPTGGVTQSGRGAITVANGICDDFVGHNFHTTKAITTSTETWFRFFVTAPPSRGGTVMGLTVVENAGGTAGIFAQPYTPSIYGGPKNTYAIINSSTTGNFTNKYDVNWQYLLVYSHFSVAPTGGDNEAMLHV